MRLTLVPGVQAVLMFCPGSHPGPGQSAPDPAPPFFPGNEDALLHRDDIVLGFAGFLPGLRPCVMPEWPLRPQKPPMVCCLGPQAFMLGQDSLSSNVLTAFDLVLVYSSESRELHQTGSQVTIKTLTTLV